MKRDLEVTFRNGFAEKLGSLFDEQETALQQQATRQGGFRCFVGRKLVIPPKAGKLKSSSTWEVYRETPALHKAASRSIPSSRSPRLPFLGTKVSGTIQAKKSADMKAKL